MIRKKIKRRNFLKCLIVFAPINFTESFINLQQQFKLLKTVDISAESTEGGNIECFVNNQNHLRKLDITQCWESGKFNSLIYVKNNKIIKIKETKTKYNRPFNYGQEIAEEVGDSEWFDDSKSIIITRTVYIDNTLIIEDKKDCSSEDMYLAKFAQSYDKRLQIVLELKNS